MMSVLPEGNVQHLWYTRRGNKVSGPHPLKQIQRYIILGRIRETDELSTDKKSWKVLGKLQELIPEVARNRNSPKNEQRLLAARMKEDERQFGDRRNYELQVEVNRRGKDRRQQESAVILEYRKFKTELAKERQTPKSNYKKEILFMAVLLVCLALTGLLLTNYSSNSPVVIATGCNGQASPGVDWTNCQLQGAQLQGEILSGSRLRSANLTGADLSGAKLQLSDLSYADLSIAKLQGAKLSGAKLTGTALRKANLANADFTGADLSYANLAEAELEGAQLENAKLDHAIWVDDSVCQPGSVGQCNKLQETAHTP